MKGLQGSGIGVKSKQAEPITLSQEEKLWEECLLGDHSPSVLLDTVVFMCILYDPRMHLMEHFTCNQNVNGRAIDGINLEQWDTILLVKQLNNCVQRLGLKDSSPIILYVAHVLPNLSKRVLKNRLSCL